MTPSSLILRRPDRENTWNPPLSVRIGPSQSHEPVQPPQSPHHVVPGTQVQVIGVGQLHLTADLPQIMGRYRSLDGPLGAHIHEHWSLDHAMGAGERSPSGFPLRLYHLKHE